MRAWRAQAAALMVALLTASPALSASDGPLSIEAARRHLESGDLDAIYLAYAALESGDHPAGDAAVAALLAEAARAALAADDAPLSVGLGEIARRLDPASPEAALAFAAAALALDQTGAAEEALDAALAHVPGEGELLFTRAQLAERERDLERAHALYGRVPRQHPRAAEARAGVRRMVEARREQESTLKEVAEIESGLLERQESAGERMRETRGTSASSPGPSGGRTVAAPAGMSARESRNFRIVYYRGERDFAERADFEMRIEGLFEDAHERVGRLFGYHPPEPVEVVLYTREEFDLRFGGRFGQGTLGFYAGKIRMNRAEDPRDPLFRRTVIHEYVHAVVDQLAHGRAERIPIWLNEGLAVWAEHTLTRTSYGDGQTGPERQYWQRQAQAMPLGALAGTSFAQLPHPTPAYMKSWAAVTALIGTGGNLQRVLQVIEETGGGRPFADAFAEAFGERRLDRLDEEANRVLGR
jgi:tetratricopeptide (TPR) repeat protein